jgi:hypothetical protein
MPRLLLARQNLRQSQAIPDPDAPESRPLAEGEVRLRIGPFALTANNITYAAFGEAMHYWQFFPAADAAWGCVPVWGFADVSESRAPEVAVGRRVYGYFPMGRWLVVQPGEFGRSGFNDVVPHRVPLPRVYNQYRWCDSDPGYDARREAEQALLRPLFATAFLIDDFLASAAEPFFGAGQLLLSSASSKTAWSTAFCVRQRAEAARPRLIGLTSARNRAYTESLGCYDEVRSYEEVASLGTERAALYVDFSGAAELRRTVHVHFDAALKYSASIGGTDWEHLGSGKGLPGPKPTLFFAPAQMAQRLAPPPQGWGPAGFAQRMDSAWAALMATLRDAPSPWLQVRREAGITAVQAAAARFIEGDVDPREGLMLSV